MQAVHGLQAGYDSPFGRCCQDAVPGGQGLAPVLADSRSTGVEKRHPATATTAAYDDVNLEGITWPSLYIPQPAVHQG